MKKAILLGICILLFSAGGTAKVFSTCPMNTNNTSVEMSTEDDIDMPCHKTTDSEDRSSNQCEDCDCQHCVQINALPVQESKNLYGKTAVGIFTDKFPASCQTDTLLQPPKHHC